MRGGRDGEGGGREGEGKNGKPLLAYARYARGDHSKCAQAKNGKSYFLLVVYFSVCLGHMREQLPIGCPKPVVGEWATVFPEF